MQRLIKSKILFSIVVFLNSPFCILHSPFFCSAQTWKTVGGGVNDVVSTLGVFNNELIVAGGPISKFGFVKTIGIGRWDGV